MKEVIAEKLNEIEVREQVRILYAAESGSRAWGFSSPDSDYDVRFVYARPAKEYLRLRPVRDVIEWQLDETLDINGWDLKKTLSLLSGSNPSLFEWAGSPIVYRRTGEWEEIRTVLPAYFDEKKMFCHYLSMAKRNYLANFGGEKIRYKKYLYVLRALLCSRWVAARGTLPPLSFDELAAAELPKALKGDIEELLRIKREVSEEADGKRNPRFEEFIAQEFEEGQKIAVCLPAKKTDDAALDELFLRILLENLI